MSKEIISINDNNEVKQLKANIEAEVSKIKVYEVLKPEDFTKAGKDIASLKKLEKDINRRRIDFKNEFDAKVVELLKPVTDKIEEFNKKTDTYNKKYEEDKTKEIRTHFDTLGSAVEFDRLFDVRYMNKTYKVEDAIQDITGKVNTINADLKIITAINTAPRLKELYLEKLDVASALDVFNEENKVPEAPIVEEVKVPTLNLTPIENDVPDKTYTLKFTTNENNYARIINLLFTLGIDLDE